MYLFQRLAKISIFSASLPSLGPNTESQYSRNAQAEDVVDNVQLSHFGIAFRSMMQAERGFKATAVYLMLYNKSTSSSRETNFYDVCFTQCSLNHLLYSAIFYLMRRIH